MTNVMRSDKREVACSAWISSNLGQGDTEALEVLPVGRRQLGALAKGGGGDQTVSEESAFSTCVIEQLSRESCIVDCEGQMPFHDELRLLEMWFAQRTTKELSPGDSAHDRRTPLFEPPAELRALG